MLFSYHRYVCTCNNYIIIYIISYVWSHDLYNTINFFNLAITDIPLYNVTWTRVDNTTVEFTCEVACRTPITGCNINLDGSDGVNKGSDSSNIINGSANAISSRFVTLVINDIDPNEECTYTATPVAIVDGESLSFNAISGIIPAAVQGS